MNRLAGSIIVTGLCFAAAMPLATHAQDWPTKPITLVVGFPPGGATDVTARLLGPPLAKQLGQSVVIENKPGASGHIGAEYVLKNRADDHTLYVLTYHQATFQGFRASMPYDIQRDFRPVGMIASLANVLVVNANSDIRSVEDYVKKAKADPGGVSCGSPGNLGSAHVLCELFKVNAKVDILHVPFNGSAPSVTALLGGQITSLFDPVPSAIPQIKGGKFRALAVSSDRRLPELPDVPTFKDLGYPELVVMPWNALIMPKSTPDYVVKKLNEALKVALADPETQEQLRKRILISWGSDNSPEVSNAVIEQTISKWRAVSQQVKIPVN
jgi:tripartite-type tricarboxylate transporter receptor subunit TctC